jgi:hypothetical protein
MPRTEKPAKLVFNKHIAKKELKNAKNLAKRAAKSKAQQVPDFSGFSFKARQLGIHTFLSMVNQMDPEKAREFDEFIPEYKNSEIDAVTMNQQDPQVTEDDPTEDELVLKDELKRTAKARIDRNIGRGARMPGFSDLSLPTQLWAEAEWAKRTKVLNPIEQERKLALNRMRQYSRTDRIPVFRDLSEDVAAWAEQAWQTYLTTGKLPTISEVKEQLNNEQLTNFKSSELENATDPKNELVPLDEADIVKPSSLLIS